MLRANADGITKKIIETLTHPSVSLDTTKTCGQAYDGAAVMSSNRAGVQAIIKRVLELCTPTLTPIASIYLLLLPVKFKK